MSAATPIDDGGPAFPCELDGVNEQGRDGVFSPRPGMTLRDWFAGQALAGLLTNSAAVMRAAHAEITRRGKNGVGDIPLVDFVHHVPTVAKSVYMYADAMIEARKAGAR